MRQMHQFSDLHTSVTYREATGGPRPKPVPTNNLPTSMPNKLFVAALKMHNFTMRNYS